MLCIAKSTLSHNWASLPTGSSRRSQYCTTERIERWTWLSTAAALKPGLPFPLPFNLPFDLNPRILANLGSGIGSSLNSLWDLHLVAYTKVKS
ncbi:hypothetical protein OIU76_007301 [Salix suchowensis]|nr:hypothetical protein OIU76_007301 [Salix suchowensis]